MKDKCIMCEKITPYDESDHIDMRNYYVEGCGQLCVKCYNEITDDELFTRWPTILLQND